MRELASWERGARAHLVLVLQQPALVDDLEPEQGEDGADRQCLGLERGLGLQADQAETAELGAAEQDDGEVVEAEQRRRRERALVLGERRGADEDLERGRRRRQPLARLRRRRNAAGLRTPDSRMRRKPWRPRAPS